MRLKRNWLQFSLRSLLAVMFAACVLMAWVAYKRNEAAEQRSADGRREQVQDPKQRDHARQSRIASWS